MGRYSTGWLSSFSLTATKGSHEEGGAIPLHLLYAALARTHLEQCIQFGSPPFERDIKRLGNWSAEGHMGKRGGAGAACSAVSKLGGLGVGLGGTQLLT